LKLETAQLKKKRVIYKYIIRFFKTIMKEFFKKMIRIFLFCGCSSESENTCDSQTNIIGEDRFGMDDSTYNDTISIDKDNIGDDDDEMNGFSSLPTAVIINNKKTKQSNDDLQNNKNCNRYDDSSSENSIDNEIKKY
jgi:hypothetical protein